MQEFLGKRIPLVCLVDNQQAITAVKRGYSKRSRCLSRTHRIAIGSLHEIVGDEKQRVEIRYIESKLQKGNIHTKAMVPATASQPAFMETSFPQSCTFSRFVMSLGKQPYNSTIWRNICWCLCVNHFVHVCVENATAAPIIAMTLRCPCSE